jgi:hypothetical protein
MSKHAELAKAPITTTTAANPFWLEQYVTTLSPSGDIVVDLKHAIDLAAQLDGGARLPDAALTLVLYAKAQIEFLNQFSRFGGNYVRATTPDIVALRLECATDILALKRLADAVNAKAPATRLAREANAALEHALSTLRNFDAGLIRANDKEAVR